MKMCIRDRCYTLYNPITGILHQFVYAEFSAHHSGAVLLRYKPLSRRLADNLRQLFDRHAASPADSGQHIDFLPPPMASLISHRNLFYLQPLFFQLMHKYIGKFF